MNRKIIIILLFVLIIACGDEQKVAELIRPVKYTEVIQTGGNRSRSFSGIAKAGIESDLSFKVSGTILYLPVNVGDTVKKGDIIAELDPQDYLLKKQEAEATLISAQAQARNSDADYARIKELYENNNASKGELDSARALAESARAQVDAAQKRLDIDNLQLSYTKLVSPVDGSIAEVPVDINENVNAGTTIVFITSGKEVKVEVAIPEILISKIEKDSIASVRFDSMPEKSFTARVTEVGVSSTAAATTYPVTVELQKTDEQLLPGMAAEVSFEFKNGEKERIIVPIVAVGEDKGGRYVYILEQISKREDASFTTGFTKRISVKIGEVIPEGIEITEGLKEGDLIVTAGVRRIKDATEVKLIK
ncbi:MAG: efflux RND transporter periplasmic adaptor subunit [Candidatus Dadabacteria bacterium]|nr:efflux RND transporter periplasmic adaptor subunit [Candidatus Dadabacteria bacterium]NIS09625.1 efflux RND transporter periplasmic adaptor subunit [Candidatus Dadabacteria bacterium]NIV40768.1 efflux RND transporter periplasmic adaptor subunit [Candidatus Dadabacteria bacterium]NIY22789.1 efflux RND transporter periplasmic adaptor subunit [Candidatus Dadabacteria bacterium]